MRVFVRIAFVAIWVTLVPCQTSKADSMHFTISVPEECPEGLKVESKAGKDGMLQYDVCVNAEQVAHAGELYKGRVKAHAILKIATAESQVASVVVHGSAEGKRTWYQFCISPSAAKTSEIQIGVSLFEKDGMQTIGGSVAMQVRLAGFVPNTEKNKQANGKQ
jgi:hypothetical protein